MSTIKEATLAANQLTLGLLAKNSHSLLVI